MPGARPVGREPLPARLAIVLPAAACWELPAYELALDCARRVGAVTLVTPEARPLDVFGEEASEAVAGWLDGAGVEVRTESTAVGVVDGALVLADGDRVPAGCVLAAPALEGPRIAGLPLDEAGFVLDDTACAVPGVEGVFAAGDATAGTTKLGSLAAHQADTAAAAIAGAPFDLPQVLRGLLLTGGEPLYLRRDAAGSRASHQALWWPPVRFPGTYLASFLISAGLSTARLTDRDPVEAT
jgi:sulfide:quinone oxidoreductase